MSTSVRAGGLYPAVDEDRDPPRSTIDGTLRGKR
jgi:hypothetical protein